MYKIINMDMIKILVTGSNGFLGSNLVHFFSRHKRYNCYSTSRTANPHKNPQHFFRGDLLDTSFTEELISTVDPDVIINTVSLVDVDLCEEEPELAEKIIAKTAENLASSVYKQNCRLIHISTDQLFDGKKSMYSEDDTPAPVNVYGKMKLKAEDITRKMCPDVIIIRTNFFGWSPPYHPPTFAEWIYNSLQDKKPITLFTDYYFCPIEVTYLAEAIELVLQSDFRGILNIAGSERCSKYDFGISLAHRFGLDTSTISASKMNPDSFKAKRQRDLSLSNKKFEQYFSKKLPDLEDSLARFYMNQGIKSDL